ncbi:hypothetical protein ABZP36_023945 [Zizania latifolia]
MATAAAARRLLSRRASFFSASALLRRGPALPESLLRSAVVAAVSRNGFLRGFARRPGGDGYSPMRSGGSGDRAPTEMAPLFPGCDYEHWLIVMDKPGGEGATKQQRIDCYIQTLAKVLGSVEEATKKIYNVSCERYFGFGCEIDEETSNKLEGLPGVLFVLPDSYVDPDYKDYGAELFVNGEIVQRPPERQRRVEPVPQRAADRPRYNDRTRYARRRENQRRGLPAKHVRAEAGWHAELLLRALHSEQWRHRWHEGRVEDYIIKAAGGAGMVLANIAVSGEELVVDNHLLPTIAEGKLAGDKIQEYTVDELSLGEEAGDDTDRIKTSVSPQLKSEFHGTCV